MTPEAKEYTPEEVQERLKRLFERFEGPRGLHARARWREQHMFLDPEVDPIMPGSTVDRDGKISGQWQAAARQTTRVISSFAKWKSRVTENPWKIEVRPMRDTIAGKAEANIAEALLEQGKDFIRERTGIDPQSNLTDAKGYKGVGVLHWRIDDARYKANMPDYDELDEVGDDDKDRYVEDEYADGRAKKKKYRETEDCLKDRIARYKAECGFPVFWETIDVEQCAWTKDKSTYSELKEFGVKRVIPSLDEWKAGKDEDKRLRERDAPLDEVEGAVQGFQPDSQDFQRRDRPVTVYEYWTRTHWYEWCDAGDETYFDSGRHYYGQPPFALDIGRYIDNSSPALAYQPVFNAMLELKPSYDRILSIVDAAVEESSILKWVMQWKGGGVPQLNADGTDSLDMAPDSGSAAMTPPGYNLEGIGGTGVNQQLFKILEQMELEMEKAEPSSGFATFSATTQPTSAWQEQAQENMEPKMHIRNTARTLQVAVNSIIRCFADAEHGPGEVFGYAKSGDGALDRSKVLSVKPEQWDNLIADVKIVEVGNVERAALEELGMVKFEKGYITALERIADYEGHTNPEELYAQRTAFNSFEKTIIPLIVREEEAKAFGHRVALAPGAVPMVQGQTVSDEQAIQAAGGSPVVKAAQNITQAGPSTSAMGAPVGAQAMGVAGPV